MTEVQDYQRKLSTQRNGKAILLILTVLAVTTGFSLFTFPTTPLIAVAILTAALIIITSQILAVRATIRELFKQKRAVLKEMQVAEIAYYKRNLLEGDYRTLIEKKNQELIKLDAQIEHELAKKEDKPEYTVLQHIASGKKSELARLLKDREENVIEARLIMERFEHRKIDEKTYQALASENRQKKVGLDAKIKALYEEQHIDDTLKEIREKIRKARSGKNLLEREKLMEIANEIAEQELSELENQEKN